MMTGRLFETMIVLKVIFGSILGLGIHGVVIQFGSEREAYIWSHEKDAWYLFYEAEPI